jgi:hypothetical protein
VLKILIDVPGKFKETIMYKKTIRSLRNRVAVIHGFSLKVKHEVSFSKLPVTGTLPQLTILCALTMDAIVISSGNTLCACR